MRNSLIRDRMANVRKILDMAPNGRGIYPSGMTLAEVEGYSEKELAIKPSHVF